MQIFVEIGYKNYSASNLQFLNTRITGGLVCDKKSLISTLL